MPFDPQPTLSGELLSLRPLTPDDYDALFAAASDPLIWEQHPMKRYKPEVFGPFFEKSLASGGALVAIDKKSGGIIGSSRYYGLEENLSEVEIGWSFLARNYWGGIYNAEMKRLMMDHALRTVDSVVFIVDPNNIRSQRAVEKIGGASEGLRVIRGKESLLYRIVTRQSRPFEVKILQFPETRVAMIEHRGDPKREHETVRKLVAWKLAHGYRDTRRYRQYGLHYTDPRTVAPEDHRVGMCMSIDEHVAPNDFGIVESIIPACRCAFARDIGTRPNNKAATFLYEQWLPHSGEQLAEMPMIFHYVNVGPDIPAENMITDVYLPLIG